MTIAAAVLAIIAIAISSVRWLRVVQREHYLPGSVRMMSTLWARVSPLNGLLAIVPVLAVLAGVFSDLKAAMVIVAALAVAAFPVGLSIRGRTSPLAWTARLKRLAVIQLALLAVAGVIGVLALTLWEFPAVLAAVALALVAVPAAMEAAMGLAVPLERRLSQKFVDEATATLNRVDPLVVGITGSYGKTSTKGYVRGLVEGTRRVVASPASFNNRMGLSRAINERLTGDAEVFIAEMGTYGPGEIADLCSWLPPEISVMTAIGPVHLERFETEENIVVAKSEILDPARVGVFNVDHDALAELAGRAPVETVWRCGTTERATDVRVVATESGMAIHRGERMIGTVENTDLFAANLACAVAVALELGVAEADVIDRASSLTAPEHRQTVSTAEAGFTIIDDTFNSNPTGAARALDVLAGEGGPQARRVVVTPGMVELGPRQEDENEAFGRAAAGVADDVVIVGKTNIDALLRGTAGTDVAVRVVASREQAVAWARTNLGPGDVVLYENDLPDHYP